MTTNLMQGNKALSIVCSSMLLVGHSLAQSPGPPVKITLEEAIQTALIYNHDLQAARTTVHQNVAQEITANLRPNPSISTDWEYMPVNTSGHGPIGYIHDASAASIGVNYLFERGQKRQQRVLAAKDATAVTRTQVVDNERTLSFQVASGFINVQLAESTLELAEQNLKSFQNTVDISENQFRAGSISENDYLKIKLQLVQFQSDLQQAQLSRAQALSDLRQQLGYEAVSADYDIAGSFEYQPFPVSLNELQQKALQQRPDLRAAEQSILAAKSQNGLAKANGKQDVSFGAAYAHDGGFSAYTLSVSIPLPIFDRNQGEIARTHYAITQAQEQQASSRGQVLTDVRDAYEAVQSANRIVQIYLSGNLDTSKKNRDISEYSYRRGFSTLLDFLDTERTYRSTQLAYRQALSNYLTAIEQLRQAVGTRNLP